jgi:hypothetical protein
VVTLAEDLYLLASNASTGRFLIDTAHLDLGLGGALLMSLALHEHVGLAGSDVVVTTRSPLGDRLLDKALVTVASEVKGHGPDHWVRRLSRGVHRVVRDHLLTAGVLRHDDDRLLHVFPVHRTPESDGRLHHDLQNHLRDSVMLDQPASQETAALASLVLAVGLERQLFPGWDRHEVRRRMARIADGGWVVPAVAGAVTVIDVALGLGPEPGPLY